MQKRYTKSPKKAPVEPVNELNELWPGQSLDLLKSLHILTRDGKLNQDSRRKLKQVQHLVQLIKPHLDGLNNVADLGAGKSYLGFMLYDLWLRERPDTRLWAIEQRQELIDACKLLASRSKFDRISFIPKSILEASDAPELPEQIEAVTALHACDTATDEAIAFALKKKAKFIALVPCCQAEVARLLDAAPAGAAKDEDAVLWRHGIHRREFGSHLTNVIRALFLESQGYKVRVTELIGWEHSMKNELILAERVQLGNGQARRQLESLMGKYPLAMKLFDLVPAPAQ
ncbi:MAG: SAM-dependent methyltransferase [Bdellovibrionota bacterium]